jgi:hypothetical protein
VNQIRLLALAAALALLPSCGDHSKTASNTTKDVVALAQQAYAAAKARGVDLERGPCLGTIAPGWVADVAHDPRQPTDDLPQNQCAAYREGRAQHFVELDPQGRLIRSG